jgi:hypothetical protein
MMVLRPPRIVNLSGMWTTELLGNRIGHLHAADRCDRGLAFHVARPKRRASTFLESPSSFVWSTKSAKYRIRAAIDHRKLGSRPRRPTDREKLVSLSWVDDPCENAAMKFIITARRSGLGARRNASDYRPGRRRNWRTPQYLRPPPHVCPAGERARGAAQQGISAGLHVGLGMESRNPRRSRQSSPRLCHFLGCPQPQFDDRGNPSLRERVIFLPNDVSR